jgi:peptide/nickel transport system permease protein
MKNALLPVLTIIGIQVSHILGGSVIMEQIFSLPGIGNYLIEGMSRRDYPVVQTLVMVFALWVVIINLVTDLMYGWLDPRIRFD